MSQNGQFCLIRNFSNLFPPGWLRMTRNGQFCPICNFLNLFPLKWLRMTQNGQFHPICNFFDLFPAKQLQIIQNGQFCPICNFSNLFPPKWLRMTWNGQFYLICNFSNLFTLEWLRMTWNGQFQPICIFSNLLPPKHLIFGEISKFHLWGEGGTSANFLSFPTFSNHFTPIQLKMTHNGKFGQNSGLDCVKMANLACFSIFFPKMRPRLAQNGQFHLIHNFSHLLPPKRLIFVEILEKIFIWGGVILANFFSFPTFQIVSHQLAENDPQWQIWPKKCLRLCQNGQCGMFFYLFPQNEAEIDSEWSISPDSQLFPSFATKASHFWRNLKNFHFLGGYIGKFLVFQLFQIVSHHSS